MDVRNQSQNKSIKIAENYSITEATALFIVLILVGVSLSSVYQMIVNSFDFSNVFKSHFLSVWSWIKTGHESQYSQVWVWIIGASAILSIIHFLKVEHQNEKMKTEVVHLEGGQLFKNKQAIKQAQKELNLMKHTGYSVEIGGISWTNDRTSKHFIVMGQTGGGKTTAIKPLIRHAIDKGDLCIIYDNKTEFTGILGAKEGYKTILLGPWDKRGAYWDLAKDLRSEQDAKQFASSIVKTKGEDSIFSLGGKAIITGALVYLMKTKPQKWTATDLFNLINKPVRDFADLVQPHFAEITALLSFDDKGEPVTATANMAQNAVAYINPLLKALMASEKSKQRISIRQFLGQLKNNKIKNQVIILQGNKQFSEIQSIIYTGFLDIASSVINSPSFPERKPDQTGVWFILDEFVQLQKLNNIKAVAEIGRSKGARLVLGFQDYAQLVETYGRDTAKVLFGICQTHIFTKLAPETAQEMSKAIGNRAIAQPKHFFESHNGKQFLKIDYTEKSETIVEPFDFGELIADKKGVELLVFFGSNVYKVKQKHLKFDELRPQYVPQSWTGDSYKKPVKKLAKGKAKKSKAKNSNLADLLKE